jgi:glycosyltransferase involved in cell wall biosynthesis
MTDRLIVLSEWTERIVLRVERVPPAKVVKIPLGFEFDEIQAPPASRVEGLRREMGLEGHFIIGIIGRLSKEKGHRYLLQALSELRMSGSKPWKLLVVGEGPLRKQLEQQLTEQNLRDRAVFTGFSEQPLAMIALMDLVVQPSLHEAFSRTMVESLALGKPLIITEVSGVREVIRDGQNGLVVPQHDPVALAAAIRRVMDSPTWARQLGAQGAHDVRVFTMERMAAAYQSCYRELLA